MSERIGNTAKVKQERKKALVIGVSDYDDLISLDLCKNDADELSSVLEKQGYEISNNNKLTGRVSAKTMREAIYDFFNDDYIKPKDTLLFYFSGHGLPDGFGNHYLAASDTAKDKPGREGISFNDLEHWSESSRSKRIVTILDCCFSGAAGLEGVKGNDDVSVAQEARNLMDRRMKESEGIYLLASSLAYQQSVIKKDLGHSLFTYYLLEGLKGIDGYMDNYGHVTADHLHNYVLDRILGEPRQLQRPIKKSKASGDILVAYYPQMAKTKSKPLEQSHSTSSAEVHFKMLEADRYEKMDDYESAISCYQEAIAIDPNYYLSHHSMGNALFQMGRYEEAIQAYMRAITSRPEHPDAYDLIGDIYFKLEDYVQALDWYNKALNIRPQSYEFLKDKGLVLYKLEDYERAITFFDASLKIKPDQSIVLQYKDEAALKLELKRGTSISKETAGIKQLDLELAKKPLVRTIQNKLNQNKKSLEDPKIKPKSISPKEILEAEEIIPDVVKSIQVKPSSKINVKRKDEQHDSYFKGSDRTKEMSTSIIKSSNEIQRNVGGIIEQGKLNKASKFSNFDALELLINGRNYEFNIRRRKFQNLNFAAVNLMYYDLANINLTRANLTNAKLQGTIFYSATLTGANLTGANLIGANLIGANFNGANLSESNITWANIRKSSFKGANLTGALLVEVDFTGANFIDCKLSNSVIIKPKNYQSLLVNEKTDFNNVIIDDSSFIDYLSNSTKNIPKKIQNKNELKTKLEERNLPVKQMGTINIDHMMKATVFNDYLYFM